MEVLHLSILKTAIRPTKQRNVRGQLHAVTVRYKSTESSAASENSEVIDENLGLFDLATLSGSKSGFQTGVWNLIVYHMRFAYRGSNDLITDYDVSGCTNALQLIENVLGITPVFKVFCLINNLKLAFLGQLGEFRLHRIFVIEDQIEVSLGLIRSPQSF